MNVTFQFEAQLRQVAGVASLDIDFSAQTVLSDALKHVGDQAAAPLRERLLRDGSLQPGVLVFVNEQPVPPPELDNYKLQDGDTVLLLPPISGG